jgi:cytochrome c oxidase subunit III
MTTASKTESTFHHAHHFDSAQHQYSSSKQGIWLFLCTEILMFGGLFVGYLIFHSLYPEIFHESAKTLDVTMGALNTVVLLFSSLTMALAISYTQSGKKNAATIMMAITIVCAGIFMVVKYFEYSHKFAVGTVPGKHSYVEVTGADGKTEKITKIADLSNQYFALKEAGIAPAEIEAKLHIDEKEATELKALSQVENWQMFFGFYFVMTGIHGIHVVAGALLIFWVMIKNMRGKVGPEYYTPVEGVGLFWHVVDLVWIYLFPLLYLVG